MRSRFFSQRCLSAWCVAGCIGGALPAWKPVTAFAHVDKASQGAELFSTRGCTHCHGSSGEGTDSGPSLGGVRHRLTTAQIEHQIVVGGQQMPAFGDTLDHNQVESLVAYLRAKTTFRVPNSAEPRK